MSYCLDVSFKPINELMVSLHAYICQKSHKKMDLSTEWIQETQEGLTAEFSSFLMSPEVDDDWKWFFLLMYLCPNDGRAENFLGWLEGLTTGDLYELIAPHSNHFPENMSGFRSRTLYLVSEWNEQYFRKVDSRIIRALQDETKERVKALPAAEPSEFVDQTTNGLQFKPISGLERVALIPQYHFQPVNFIAHFGKLTLCHYAARIYFDEEDFLSPHEYRMIRSISEKSRLKILRFLHQGPRSFIEIARHLELSKGITHDHLTRLRSAGMITVTFEGETVSEYSLRPGALQQMQDSLIAYIEQG